MKFKAKTNFRLLCAVITDQNFVRYVWQYTLNLTVSAI